MIYDLRRIRFGLICAILIFFIHKSYFLNLKSVFAVENPQSYQIEISATIGEPKLTLFGYTSPNALVQLDGQRVAEQVIADISGYFFFDRIFLPLPTRDSEGKIAYPELCLTSIDTQSRISFPTCLPQLPIGPFNITVGPVLLSPTLSLSKGSFLPKEEVVAQGLTIPNSEVIIYLANDSSNTRKNLLGHFISGIIKPIYAYSLPQYQVKADQNGHFEFNLPTIKKANWKIFAGAVFQNSPTPKSNTLNFKIQSWWGWLWQKVIGFLKAIFGLLRPFVWLMVILMEIIIVSALLFKLKKTKQQQNSSFEFPVAN